MSDLSKTVEQSSLWKYTLAQVETDPNSSERERLRSSFISFRNRASLLAKEIAKDLPDLTIHDITHLDALWEVASQLVGANFPLTPTEGYVLGGSILLHDLAMSVASTPGGIETIKLDSRWKDSIHSYFHQNLGRVPVEDELRSPPTEVHNLALFSLLRQVHAENAERLAFIQFGAPISPQYLIEDTELRQTFGRVIGQIAHSHWWSLSEIERRFDRQIGAPHWAPSSWIIDPLKIACILRAADAAHLDARRAPSFQKVFMSLSPASRVHWEFQERLNKAYVKDDALVFTSGLAFSLADSNAWWLCLDTLRMVDSELRGIDSLLAERSIPRFAARRVAGIDQPERLAKYIQTIDWHPIHAAVHLSDLPNIVRSLGGEELYGNNPIVPVRELIQNASDAIRARRFYEERPSHFGQVVVELLEQSGSFCLRVKDNGIGMSARVLTQYLLDFGSSFWSKPQVQEEFPGLLSSDFRSTGRYGIGFFSVFMQSDRVKVITRRPDAAAINTLVLEFGSGLDGRPILRPAQRDEQLRDGGTIIELELRKSPYEKGGLLRRLHDEPPIDLASVCRQIAPNLDVELVVINDGRTEKVIQPQDWLSMPGEALLRERCPCPYEQRFSEEDRNAFVLKASENLTVLSDEHGIPIARICITATEHYPFETLPLVGGAITVGGFVASRLHGIAGFIVGESTRASRDHAKSTVTNSQLSNWASMQASLIPALYEQPESQASAAEVIRICGGQTGDLPIAKHKGKWISGPQIAELTLPDELVILDWHVPIYDLKYLQNLEFNDNVFITNVSSIIAVFQDDFLATEFKPSIVNGIGGMPTTLAGAVMEAFAQAWGVSQAALAANNFEREVDIFVGTASIGEIKSRAYVVRKPKGN